MYIVIELQTNGTTTSTLTYNFTDRNTAYQKFHTILASAAVSSVKVHAAMIVNEYGLLEARESFEHGAEE